MIVTCPNCQTRFVVDDAVLGAAAGRRMRCASCGHLWHYSLAAAAVQAGVVEASAAAEAGARAPAMAPASVAEPLRAGFRTASPANAAGPRALPRPSVVVEMREAARRRGSRFAGLSLLVLAAGVVLVAILARDVIVAIYPPAAPVYATFRLIEPAGAGLEITLMPPKRTADSFIVDGDIANKKAVPQLLPRLRVTLRDRNRTALESRIVDPPVETLQPGATAHFNTVFEHPSITALGAEVTFATD